MTFHPSSPPSEGGVDSYKYEDTPDTRLTVFSPQEDSARSSRLLNALTLSTDKNNRVGKYGVSDSSFHRTASMDSIASVIHDKDPFISTTPEKTQTTTQLSATASSFEPSSSSVKPAAVSGPANKNNMASTTTPKPMGRVLDTVPRSPTTGYQVWNALPLSAAFSFELDLSRSIHITCASGHLDDVAISQYFVVSRECPIFKNFTLTSPVEPAVVGWHLPVSPTRLPRWQWCLRPKQQRPRCRQNLDGSHRQAAELEDQPCFCPGDHPGLFSFPLLGPCYFAC